MTDSNLVRHLQAQTALRVDLIDLQTVRHGAPGIRSRMGELRAAGVAVALVDATSEQDLDTIAEAVVDLPLITGGSGIGAALPGKWQLPPAPAAGAHDRATGPVLILSGSCSAATISQLRRLQSTGSAHCFGFAVETLASDPATERTRLTTLAEEILSGGESVCIYSTASAESRASTFERLRRTGLTVSNVSQMLEAAFGDIARRLVRARVTRKIIVAGGETSGAVVGSLGWRAMEVTAVLDPGVPALRTLGSEPAQLALKSGNFGSEDFFVKTIRHWEN
jgi:uncharacterized protein YgbK (DUF1537 family)